MKSCFTLSSRVRTLQVPRPAGHWFFATVPPPRPSFLPFYLLCSGSALARSLCLSCLLLEWRDKATKWEEVAQIHQRNPRRRWQQWDREREGRKMSVYPPPPAPAPALLWGKGSGGSRGGGKKRNKGGGGGGDSGEIANTYA